MEELYSLKQGNLCVTGFFTQLKSVWSELENFQPILPSVCGQLCMCQVYRDQDCVMRFLKGLNDQYSGVRSQILLMSPLPEINDVCGLVIQQERQFMSENREGVKALATTNFGAKGVGVLVGLGNGAKGFGRGKTVKGQYNSNSGKVCSFCGKTGHTVDTCFKKHGFPPHFKRNSNAASVNNVAATSEDGDDEVEQVEVSQPPNISLT